MGQDAPPKGERRVVSCSIIKSGVLIMDWSVMQIFFLIQLQTSINSSTAKVVLKVTLIDGFILLLLQVILLLKLLIRSGNQGGFVCESYFPHFQANGLALDSYC
jgi:hypothetical protein